MSWLEGWGNNILRFTIDSSKVDSNLTDFPVLITLSSGTGAAGDYDATSVFDELGSNKKRIAITTADGETQCPVEIEYWDETEEVGHLWTKVPTVYSSVDTTLYLYYDNDHLDNSSYVGDVTDAKAEMVVDRNIEGTYDVVNIAGPAVIKDGSTYKMWYSGYDGTSWRILYADSSDGLTWANHQMVIDKNTEGVYDTDSAHVPYVIKEGSLYKMWYSGRDSTTWRGLYAESLNGTTWSGHQMVVDVNQEGTYDVNHALTPTVIKDGSVYKMWYMAFGAAAWRILYATSSNGTSWSNYQMVMDLGPGGGYDDAQLYSGHVFKEGTTYKHWYGGHDGTNIRIMYADSNNGTTWSNRQLVLDIGLEGINDATSCYYPGMISEDGVYKLWYTGSDGSNTRILYAKSFNGIDWITPSQAVWTNDYVAVYHMNQEPTAVSGIKDSTFNEHHGTPYGSMMANDLVDGQIGKALSFDGVDDFIEIYSDGELAAQNTISVSAWIRPTNIDNAIFVQNDDDAGKLTHLFGLHNDFKLKYDNYDPGGGGLYSTDVVVSGSWSYVGLTRDNNDVVFYINESSSGGGTGESRDSAATVDRTLLGARYYSAAPQKVFVDNIEEVRISSTARSSAWMKTDYYSTSGGLLSFDPLSYLEGQCTDRYGVPMDVVCNVVALDGENHSVLGFGMTVSGTGLFSIRVYGKEAGSKVLVTYGYSGDYLSSSYPAGAEYMTTISGTTLSGGGY